MADETYSKSDLDKAIKEAVDEATKGLKTNLETALDEAKEAKRKLRAASEIKPEDLTAAEERADKAEKALADATKQVTTLTKERDTAVKNLETESAFTHKLVVENGLREQLTAAGVTNPAHQKGAIAMLASQVQIAAEGDNRVAKVGDKVLADYVKEWAGTDEGKAFVSAPVNGGGGAPGSKTTDATVTTMTRAAYDALDQTAKGEIGLKMAKGEVKLVDQAA
jgi:hypothetical protein